MAKHKIITHAEKKIVLENFFSLSTLQGINYILPILVLPYLIRVIGPEKFGLIAFAQSFVQYFMIITDYGFSLSATRKISLCAEDKACAIFSSVMTVKIILAALSFLVMAAIVYFIPRFRNEWLIFVLSFGAVIGNTLFPAWFFQGKEKMIYTASINIIGGIIYALSVFVFIKGPGDYLLLPFFNSLFFLVTGFIGLRIAFREFKLEYVFQTYKDIKEELKTGWNIFISTVAINTYTTTRIFIVGLLTNNTLTGFYAIAEKIAGVIQSFPLDAFTQAVYPRLSKIFHKNKKRSLKLMYRLQHSTTVTYMFSLPIAILLSPLIVRVICGKAYPETIITLRFLIVGVFFVVANAFRTQFLLVSGKSEIYSRIHVAAAWVGLPVLLYSVWLFSYLGAAFSTVAIELGILVLTLKIMSRLK
ncbi:MAG: flippase [Candidatus Omnitrophica bacterium]|jgi:PST family polysaccharide transporter|nr:flippase [Candidatus Omnitrophota bacterium]